jgi:hypothetical protein
MMTTSYPHLWITQVCKWFQNLLGILKMHCKTTIDESLEVASRMLDGFWDRRSTIVLANCAGGKGAINQEDYRQEES